MGCRFFKSVRPFHRVYLTNLGVEDGKEQLRSINVGDIVSDMFAEDTIGDKAPQFDSTFRVIRRAPGRSASSSSCPIL